jgi:CheY-like chemotaxis protein
LDALEYLKSKKVDKDIFPDLLFLDINMPGMNGWDFIQEFERLNKELQDRVIIIMLTTSDNDEDVAKAKALNFVSDYITKPLTEEIMKGIIKKYFD